jgi:NAD(P)H-nitrite reductase large subunit
MTGVPPLPYLIIGNSVGGIAAVEAIRSADRDGLIAIVSDEPYPVYSRPLISEYLAQPGPIEKILYRKPDFYEKNAVRTVLGKKVMKISPPERTATLEDGQLLNWRRLLLATGGAPIVTAVPGATLKGVFTFNKLDDARAIDAFLGRRRHGVDAVVVGGGLIGVSVTEALRKRGIGVTIIEMKDRVLNTILDEEGSAMEAQALSGSGVNVITGHTVVSINARLPGEVSSVTLDDGRVLPCEMVVIAIGVRPRLELARESGIGTDRGIVVDRRMMTSAPDVYACGDAAQAHDFVLGESRPVPVWPNAYEGGRVAGLNMAGVPTDYPGGTAMNAMRYFGVHIVSAGLTVAPDDSYEVLSRRQNGVYRKVIVKDGKVTGLLFAGDIEKSGIIYTLMKDGVDVADFKKALIADDFGLASLPAALRRARFPRPDPGAATVKADETAEEALIGD